MGGEVFPDPSLQQGSLAMMHCFQDKLIEESQGVRGPLVKTHEDREGSNGPKAPTR